MPQPITAPVTNAPRERVPLEGQGPLQLRRVRQTGRPEALWEDDERHADIAAATELIASGALTRSLVKLHSSAAEISARAGVKSETVRAYRKAKKIPAHEVGARVAAVIVALCAEADALGDQ